jgi:hypothetical protein
MGKRNPIKIEIVDETAGRFIVQTFADGTQQREPIVKLPRKKRYPPRPYWHWKLKGGSEE